MAAPSAVNALAPASPAPGADSPRAFPGSRPPPWRVTGRPGADGAQRWPLHERAAAQAAETAALAQAPPFSLMARAGLSVARLARALAPHARRVWVLAGPGHNGGDGLVAARWLHRAGLQVRVWMSTTPERLPPDAARAWREAQAEGLAFAMLDAGPPDTAAGGPPPDLLIDALLGLGAQRAPAGAVAHAIELGRALAAQGVPVLAVDLPSGLHPDTGQPLGTLDQVLPATATLCLLTLRPACFTGLGRDLAGTVWLDDLGCSPAPGTAWLGGPTAAAPPAHAAHKGSQGDVAVVGGAAGMAGAAWLAASAALAAGAGRVYVSLLDPDASGLNLNRPELMARPRLWQAPPDWLQQRTLVVGCGGGHDIAAALPALLAHAGRLLLDADALNALASSPALQAQLQQRCARGAPTVMTPHPLEAARLLDTGTSRGTATGTASVQADRLAAARALAQRYGAVVVLKGSGSVVASPAAPGRPDSSGHTSINPSGNASLATAGTGDVLAGWLGGRWATGAGQGALAGEVHTLVEAGVWEHGAAADRHRAAGCTGPLLAANLVSALAASRAEGRPWAWAEPWTRAPLSGP